MIDNLPNGSVAGKITREATAWCRACCNWHQGNAHMLIGELKRGGWKRLKLKGWTCPECLAKPPHKP